MSDAVATPSIASRSTSRAASAAALTVTERNFLRAMIYTSIIVAVFTLGWAFERYVLKRQPGDIRFIREGSEAAMRYITIPHIIIGFLFMWSSPKNRNLKQRLWAIGLLMAGAGLCTIYGMGGGKTNIILYSGVYLYFLVHELRDEAMFYSVLGDAPPIHDRAAFQGLVRTLTGLIVISLGCILWSGGPWGFYSKKVSWAIFDGTLSVPAKAALSFGPIALLVLGYVVALRHYATRLGFADVKSLIRTHLVLFRVMLGVAAVLGLSLLITQRAFSLILFHVVAWYIFAAHQFLKHPPKVSPNGVWQWMRTTVRGFKTLHIGMVVILMTIGVVWTVLGPEQTPALKWLLAPESFLYWTIMHITVSFVPR